MKRIFQILIVFSLLQFYSCNNDDDYVALQPEENEQLSGGGATVFNASAEAFGFFVKDLTFDEQSDFGIGNSFFRQSWVSAPSSTTARDGLGPFYNAVSCASCHFKDGRGRPPLFDGELGHGLLLRLSIAGQDIHGNSLPDPTYGSQLQDNSILGPTPKGMYTISYQSMTETFSDGTIVTLQKPIYTITNLGYGSLAPNLKISPRIANQMVGLGLLEAIPDDVILAFADENDSNNDGISGKANYAYDIASKSQKLGRFGWKGNQPNVKQQVAAAFLGDIGITSSLFPDENCPPGIDCGSIPNGGSPEITDISLNRVAFYSSTLAVPARRDFDVPEVLKGKKIFQTLNCTACHIPKIQTGTAHPIAAMRNQTIRPYTDLLLHDMGSDLADDAPEFLASGSEWKTPALWGIGLIKTVNGHTNLMHDGRAKNVEEAILWHSGEAKNAKEGYKKLTLEERNNLLDFINSL